jgi:glyoxylase-like metal-dependent hydrolase (beta-lactamase superfamily II)
MNIEIIPVGPYAVNCSVIWGDEKQAIVIDPGFDADEIAEALERNGLSVAIYILTHGHADHTHDLCLIQEKYPAPVMMHAADAAWAFGPSNTIAPYYGVPGKPEKIERLLKGNEVYTDGGLTYQVICTPGHSPGGICIYFESEHLLISGDTLFRESVGRTDFPGGDARALSKSVKELATLPEETQVVCGHGPRTTIGYEKKNNFYMR